MIIESLWPQNPVAKPIQRQIADEEDRQPAQSLTAQIYAQAKNGLRTIDRYSRLHGRFLFDDRRKQSKVLVCFLAGYKRELWPFVLPRLQSALPDVDVCVVSPGLWLEELAELCRRHEWSYLRTATNDVSLAQNICYRLHDNVSMIVKIDEDMFLLPNTIAALLDEYQSIKKQGIIDPGFVAPMIPLNGFCYRYLLEMLGRLEEFEALFGTARLATAGIAIHSDPSAARWIWETTAPLVATAAQLAATETRRLLCPIQFSIGMVAFERSFWELIGYLPVYRHRLLVGNSTLGGDEAYMCARAVEVSRPAVVTTAALAGHFSFGPQYSALRELLNIRPELFLE